jgi:hypothetical protein
MVSWVIATPTVEQGEQMDITAVARAAGLTVLLDGRIGREEYRSVSGSLSALERFADLVLSASQEEGTKVRASLPDARTQSRK